MKELGAAPLHAVARAAAMVVAVLAAVGIIARIQPGVARSVRKVKETDDVYALPPPEQLRTVTLGYRAAAVNLLWAKLLIEYGSHFQDKAAFPDLPRYLDAILALEPDFRPVFRYADTLLFYKPGPAPDAADVETVRTYVARGLAARPADGELWMQYGQFLAFTAPSVYPPAEREALESDGARLMARGVELGAETSRMLSVATLLDRNGARAAAIDNLRRSYALTDDPDTREQIALRLASLEGTRQRDEAEAAMKQVESRWQSDFDFLSRGEYLLVGPVVDPLQCAGSERSHDAACALDWSRALEADKPLGR